ncbi:hypothetical protein CONLIGDRAFT_677930 [Coniochaeta ligniaria NRRL 30616]|uniref:Uncharacterized protein n=1 Tax=Coniochaeta ligniaria NRRL 30616 TaxID=1408157 RepID=A0A1J7K254_9PEZI|nr:hypothetical protein CONLIGDRAFT_677930 [Coniochaeta ligniaria NRRL 30616]
MQKAVAKAFNATFGQEITPKGVRNLKAKHLPLRTNHKWTPEQVAFVLNAAGTTNEVAAAYKTGFNADINKRKAAHSTCTPLSKKMKDNYDPGARYRFRSGRRRACSRLEQDVGSRGAYHRAANNSMQAADYKAADNNKAADNDKAAEAPKPKHRRRYAASPSYRMSHRGIRESEWPENMATSLPTKVRKKIKNGTDYFQPTIYLNPDWVYVHLLSSYPCPRHRNHREGRTLLFADLQTMTFMHVDTDTSRLKLPSSPTDFELRNERHDLQRVHARP